MFIKFIWFVTFSSTAGSRGGKDAGTMPDESPNMRVGELWPKIDQLDEVDPRNASVPPAENQNDQALHSRMGSHEVEVGYGDSRVGKDVPGSLTCPPRGCEEGSVSNKAVQILADAAGAVLPRMRCSFVDRRYSPSTGMDHSEWKIILEELICMEFLVMREPVSEGEDE
jgi:hypothetical protein